MTRPRIVLPTDVGTVQLVSVDVDVVTVVKAAAIPLSRSTFPLVVSAAIVEPDRLKGAVLPIPVAAFKSITEPVTRPAPLIEPTLVIVTSLSAAVDVPVRITLPVVVVVNDRSSASS